MPKFCVNGHQMEDAWSDCPYCQRTGFQRTGMNDGLGKTRIELSGAEAVSATSLTTPPTPSSTTPSAPDARKTVLLSTLRRAPVVGWLVAMNGTHKGEDFRLREGQNIIGSASGVEVNLNDQAISAKHASIRYRDGFFTLTDLDSTNGTFLNDGIAEIAREELKDNDVIRVGEVSLKFKCL